MDMYDITRSATANELLKLKKFGRESVTSVVHFSKSALANAAINATKAGSLTTKERSLFYLCASQGVGEGPNPSQPTPGFWSSKHSEYGGFSLLLAHFPMLTGHVWRNLSQLKLADAIEMCNSDLAFLSMAHLYRAALKAGLLRQKWDDMEALIAYHGDKSLGLVDSGVSTRPMMHHAKFYAIALGVEPKKVAKVRARGQLRRQPLVQLPTLAVALRRMPKLRAMSDFEEALQKSTRLNHDLGFSQKGTVPVAIYRTAQKAVERGGAHIPQAIRQQWKICHKLSPTQTLAALQANLVREELFCYFDYHMFLLDCHDIFKGLIIAINDGLTALKVTPLAHDIPLHHLTNQIFWDAADIEHKSASSYASLLGLTSEVFNRVISETGDQRLQGAKLWSSGHIPEILRPSFLYAQLKAPKEALGLKVLQKGCQLDIERPKVTPEEAEIRREISLLTQEYQNMVNSAVPEGNVKREEARQRLRAKERLFWAMKKERESAPASQNAEGL